MLVFEVITKSLNIIIIIYRPVQNSGNTTERRAEITFSKLAHTWKILIILYTSHHVDRSVL